jgi:integrase
MTRKFGNKKLPRGISIKRGKVWIRLYHSGIPFLKSIGPADSKVIDDAILMLNQYREQIRLGKFGLNEKCRRVYVSEAVSLFRDLHAQHKKSFNTLRGFLKRFDAFFAGRYLDTITETDILRYKQERLRSISPSAFNKEKTMLVTMFNKLKEWRTKKDIGNIRLPENNPAAAIKRDREFPRRRVMSQEEFVSLMRVATPNTQRILLGAVHTLLRLKDLKGLTRDNVNAEANRLEGVQAKTGKPYAIPINAVVRQLIDTAPEHKIFDFTNFRKDFERAVNEAEIKNFQFKDLRRTGARQMLKKGVDIATVSDYLGHSSIQMTQIYVPPSQDDKQIAAEILGTSYTGINTQNGGQNGGQQGENTPKSGAGDIAKNAKISKGF